VARPVVCLAPAADCAQAAANGARPAQPGAREQPCHDLLRSPALRSSLNLSLEALVTTAGQHAGLDAATGEQRAQKVTGALVACPAGANAALPPAGRHPLHCKPPHPGGPAGTRRALVEGLARQSASESRVGGPEGLARQSPGRTRGPRSPVSCALADPAALPCAKVAPPCAGEAEGHRTAPGQALTAASVPGASGGSRLSRSSGEAGDGVDGGGLARRLAALTRPSLEHGLLRCRTGGRVHCNASAPDGLLWPHAQTLWSALQWLA